MTKTRTGFKYEELNVDAKIRCLYVYVNIICAYEYWDDILDVTDVEECVKEFLKASDEHKIDFDGNWYWYGMKLS